MFVRSAGGSCNAWKKNATSAAQVSFLHEILNDFISTFTDN